MAQDLEQKARSSASVEHDLSHSEAHVRGYLAGAAEVQKWIPVSERLPKEGHRVLGFRNIIGSVSVVMYSSTNRWMFYYEPEYASDITHWRELGPLPTTDCKSEVE